MKYKLMLDGHDLYRFLMSGLDPMVSFTMEFELTDFAEFESTMRNKLASVSAVKVNRLRPTDSAPVPLLELAMIGNMVSGAINEIVKDEGGCVRVEVDRPDSGGGTFTAVMETPTKVYRQMMAHTKDQVRFQSF